MVLSRVSGLPESGGARTQRPHGRNRQCGSSHFAFLFHPDCDRRPWHRTRSADPFFVMTLVVTKEGARGLPRRVADTAGGEFRPALRTLSALRADARILRR